MFEVIAADRQSRARAGRLTTPHGVVETPSYVIVGTDAEVRCLEPEDIPETKTQIIIANTYHIWRTWGDDGLGQFPGLHSVMGWDGPIMTDSGGFQVFSMGFAREHGVSKVIPPGMRDTAVSAENREANIVRVTESGVYFEDGGEEIYLDAELSIKIQEQLGADIIFAFDECASPLHGHDYQRKAMERTHRWARRSLEAKESKQILYGIVQGGNFEDLRRESAQCINGLSFEGVGIGGSFGKDEMTKVISWVVPHLSEKKPRHLLGIGRIEDIFRAVELGIDTFDCVIPTREARHAAIWTERGRYEIVKGRYRNDDAPLEEGCECPVCSNGKVGKKDLYSLFKMKNPEAGRIATIHNVYFFNQLMENIRESIRGNRFLEYKKSYLQNLGV